jgi:transcriptional regulator with PAS, ATPase and Fis domain
MDTLEASTQGEGPDEGATERTCLFVVLDCDQPLQASSRHDLETLDEVLIGRGERREYDRSVRGVRRTLSLRLADRRVSQEHARLVRRIDDWILEDRSSSNGTRLNGVACTEATPLTSGDVIEIGHTFLLFKEYAELRPAAPGGAEDASDLERTPTADPLSTLAVPWAARLADVRSLATSALSIILTGETGTGKEVLARAIHAASGRSGQFVAVNCAAIASSLLETELFGYRRGAFSGANEDRLGLLRAADHGTIFFDEIAELAPPAQAALLRAIQEREVLPVGSTAPVKVDVRVLSATHASLEGLVEKGTFRADLLARLRGRTIALPPLRERPEDIGILVGALLERLAAGRAGRPPSFSSKAARALLRFPWPLNVRQLEKALEGAFVLATDGRIDVAHLPEDVAEAGVPKAAVDRAVHLSPEDRARRDEIAALLREHGGNISAVARAMGKARVQLQRWIRRYGLIAGK